MPVDSARWQQGVARSHAEHGGVAVEYALVTALVSLALLIGAALLGLGLEGTYEWVRDSVTALFPTIE